MPKALAWARPWAVARPLTSPMLRSGAWYPVIESDPSGIVSLEVQHHTVTVPARLLEVRRERPGCFTVVYRGRRERNPASGTRRDVGRRYAVCPASGHRILLEGQPDILECPRCGYRGRVAWGETG